MDLREIKYLVRQGENEHVEFKKKINHPDKVIRELVAFANTNGGTLLVGVDDNGEISGLKHAEEDDYLMKKAIAELSRPKLQFKSGMVKLHENRAVLYYQISPSKRKPHYALETPKQRWGQAYVRYQDKSVQASREMTEVLRSRRGNKEFGFSYGEEERLLLQCLDKEETMSVSQFSEKAGLTRARASKIMVLLTLTNVLRIIPTEKGDLFAFKH
jgi:predicted HTH transcriptional regulator